MNDYKIVTYTQSLNNEYIAKVLKYNSKSEDFIRGVVKDLIEKVGFNIEFIKVYKGFKLIRLTELMKE